MLARNLIEGRRNFDVQGTLGVAAGAGTPLASRSIICLPIVAAASVLLLVSALSLLMVRLLHLWEEVARFVWICRYASARGHSPRPRQRVRHDPGGATRGEIQGVLAPVHMAGGFGQGHRHSAIRDLARGICGFRPDTSVLRYCDFWQVFPRTVHRPYECPDQCREPGGRGGSSGVSGGGRFETHIYACLKLRFPRFRRSRGHAPH